MEHLLIRDEDIGGALKESDEHIRKEYLKGRSEERGTGGRSSKGRPRG